MNQAYFLFSYFLALVLLRGNCTPNQKLACFVLFLKIINTFLQIIYIIYTSYSKLFKELKNGIDSLVGQAVFKLRIKTVKILFWSITQEPLNLLEFWCFFWVHWTIDNKMHINYYFRKGVDNFEIEHKTC